MTVERATPPDLTSIQALEEWFPERERWSLPAWREEIDGPGRCVLVGRLAQTGEVVGAATFQIVGETVDLHRVVVAGPHRRRGLARAMLVTGLRWAAGCGATHMMLEVRSDNAQALGLYHHIGFRVIARRADYYGSGADAHVCQAPLAELDLEQLSTWGRKEQS